MNIEIPGLDKVDYIIHIADVHIRNVHRHDEYSAVFENTYAIIRNIKEKYPDKRGLIFLGGDIVHAKLDMSPELVSETFKFFKTVSTLLPTILITGNHDCNLKNTHRLDALTPIVETIVESGYEFHYLRDSGIYTVGDVDFIVWSVFDSPEDYILPKSFESTNKKVVLYHGPVDQCVTQTGLIMDSRVKTDMFSGAYAGLLGDIHKHQYLDSAQRIAYPSSLIQQNHGEELRHGFLFWDFTSDVVPKSKYIYVDNPYGYFTVTIESGEIVTDMDRMPKRPRLRIRSNNTTKARLLELIQDIKNAYDVQDVAFDVKSKRNRHGNGSLVPDNIDVHDVAYQNELVRQILTTKYNIDDDKLISSVYELNIAYNAVVQAKNDSRNVIWKPRRFTFSNMFSYGEDNVIDFTNMSGIYGLFAPNASGKSSIFDALAFCAFDTCSKTFKASYIMNNKSDSFKCSLEFDINGQPFKIVRTATKGKANTRVDVSFTTEVDGNEVILNGKDRDETNKIIRTYIGTYDDFVLTALSVQNKNINFVDMRQQDRKDLLAQFMDIDIFDRLHTLANDDYRDLKAAIKVHSTKNYPSLISEQQQLLKGYNASLDTLTETIDTLTDEVNTATSALTDLYDKKVPVSSTLSSLNITSFTETVNLERKRYDALCTELEQYDDVLKTHKTELESAQHEFDSLEIIEDVSSEIKTTTSELQALRLRISSLEQSIASDEKQVRQLHEEHEYDPNCKYCVNNVFVKDALIAEERLPKYREELNELRDREPVLYRHYESLLERERLQREYRQKQDQLNSLKSKYDNAKERQNVLIERRDSMLDKIERSQTIISEYEVSRDSIEHNLRIDDEIGKCNSTISRLRKLIDESNSERSTLNGKIALCKEKISEYQTENDSFHALANRAKSLELYVKCLHRDGVPNLLIAKSLPVIEHQTNLLLEELVDFRVLFEMDDKNILTYMVYSDDDMWPLELASGFEKFISSIAIRIGLVHVSNLPRPSFFVIDEGFGVADDNGRANLSKLFDYIRDQFTFSFIVSHIESMRDMVDKVVDITKVNGQSSIQLK